MHLLHILISFIITGYYKDPSLATGISTGKQGLRTVWLMPFITVVGLLPMYFGLDGMDKFLRPADFTLSYSLFIGTFLILFFIPTFYLIFSGLGDKAHQIFQREFLKR